VFGTVDLGGRILWRMARWIFDGRGEGLKGI
jgi:hypothetical protein